MPVSEKRNSTLPDMKICIKCKTDTCNETPLSYLMPDRVNYFGIEDLREDIAEVKRKMRDAETPEDRILYAKRGKVLSLQFLY
jgi:hypothetical protein